MDINSFQRYVSEAPALLDSLAALLSECARRELRLPAGIRNLCSLTWDELTTLPPKCDSLRQSRNLAVTPRHSTMALSSSAVGTEHRVSDINDHTLLDVDLSPSTRQPIRRPSAIRGKKQLAGHLDDNMTFIPVTSTVRLYQERSNTHLAFSLTYKEVSEVVPQLPRETLEVCLWASQKLRSVLDQIEAESTGSEDKVVTRQYGVHRFRQVPPNRTSTPDLLFPTIPCTKHLGHSVPLKFHYGLPDKTSFTYYPSGSLAVCQVPSADGGGRVYTNVYSDGPHDNMLASFLPCGRGFIYHSHKPRCSVLALLVSCTGGQEWNTQGSLTKQWTFKPQSKRQVLHTYKVNDSITVIISNHMKMSVNFSVSNEDITLSITDEEKPMLNEGMEFADLTALRAELQSLRRRSKHAALRWLSYYLTATGLNDNLPTAGKATPVKRREAWTATPRVHLTTEQTTPTSIRPTPLRRKIIRPSTCCLPIKRASPVYRPTSHRVKSTGLPLAYAPLSPAPGDAPPSPCPVVLRLVAQGIWWGQDCRCSTRLPLVTDLELDVFLQARCSPPNHTLIFYVTSSLQPTRTSHQEEAELQRLHHRQVYASSAPCVKSSRDQFRLVKYDISAANRLTHTHQPLLVDRHDVGPGAILMYMGDRLVYGGYLLNGYSFSVVNLLKQLSKAQSDYAKGHFLPEDYKLGDGDLGWPVQTDSLRYKPNRPARLTAVCSGPRENNGRKNRSGGVSAMDFVMSCMSHRETVLDMINSRSQSKPKSP